MLVMATTTTTKEETNPKNLCLLITGRIQEHCAQLLVIDLGRQVVNAQALVGDEVMQILQQLSLSFLELQKNKVSQK